MLLSNDLLFWVIVEFWEIKLKIMYVQNVMQYTKLIPKPEQYWKQDNNKGFFKTTYLTPGIGINGKIWNYKMIEV